MQKSNKQIAGFNYDKLPPTVAREAELIAGRIKSRLNSTIVDTGRDLIIVKKRP
jgi:hypothetical protein